MKTKLYTIKTGFARRGKMPSIFAGIKLRETERAVYLYGHGTMVSAKTGSCCICGRKLTHPVSVVLGIGPVCGEHWWDWNLIGGFTEENIERLKKEMEVKMKGMLVDSWVPKSVIKTTDTCEEAVTLPAEHKMSEKKRDSKPQIKRRAILVKFKSSGEIGLRVAFPYDPKDVNNIKTLEGRKFVPDGKYWTAPLTIENVDKLQEWKFEVDDRVEEYLKRDRIKFDDVDGSDLEVLGLQMDLYPYQKDGVAFTEAKNGRVLIADEMGLGKTAQALAWLQLHPKKRVAIIVVPASLKLNWEREAFMWMRNPNVEILGGKTPYPTNGKILVINYDILAAWVDYLIGLKPKVVIADEIHYAKNNGAKRTKALKKLAKHVKHFIGLSGTPIVNRPVEFYNAISMINPNLFPSFWTYTKRYCNAKRNHFGWDFTGATNTDELHQKLRDSIMIRRKKSDVLKDLPDKIRSSIPCELKNRKHYDKAESDFISFVKQTKGEEAAIKASGAETLTKIEGLKQIAVEGKMVQAVEWIQDFLEVEEKLVVFATHKFVVDKLMEVFKDIVVKIDGSVTGAKRQEAVDRFQKDPKTRLFVGNIKAAGVGITLTAASSAVFLELPWTP